MQQILCSPSRVERTDVVADGEAEVGDGYDDGDLVPGHQQTHQARLEHVGREEGEEHNDEGEDETNILDPENKTRLQIPLSSRKGLSLSDTHTNITSRITLSKRKSSEKVLMRRSITRKMYWTVSMERYLVRDSFISRCCLHKSSQCEVASTTTKYLRKSGRYFSLTYNNGQYCLYHGYSPRTLSLATSIYINNE